MKDNKIEIGGQAYYLLFNGTAMFDLEDERDMSERLCDNTKDGFEWLCKAAAVMAEQGELARRYKGYDKGPILAAEAVKTLVMPTDIPSLRQAVFEAVMAGYGREVKDEREEVDLGLLELQKKTGKE